MPIELRELAKEAERRTCLRPGDKGFLILAKVRGLRNVHKEALKKFKPMAEQYYKEKSQEASVEEEDNGTEPVKKENGVNSKGSSSQSSCPIVLYPQIVYDNCTFLLTNLVDPSDFAHYLFSKIADHPEGAQPRFPLRIMPIQVVCHLQQKAMETAITPVLEKIFGGEESIRFSFILHSKKPSPDMSLHEAEAVVRNCLWSINPNCVQCLKYQDFAIMIEIVDPLILVGIAKDFNQLGRYNTFSVIKGRDLKETMEDSEDDISDDPNLTDDGNMKRKLEIKRKRKLEKVEEAKSSKQAKTGDIDDTNEEAVEDKEELNGDDE